MAKLQTDTTLALMTNDEFNSRQQALERAAAEETNPTPVIETLDLLVLRKAMDKNNGEILKRGVLDARR